MHEPVIRSGDHILVGDGEKALFFQNEGNALEPRFKVVELLQHTNPPTREQGTDKPGRYNEGPFASRSAVEQTDWHGMEKQRFLRSTVENLKSLMDKGNLKRLHLDAPPRALGTLREAMPRVLRNCVVSETDKDLTRHPVREIERNLRQAR